MRIYSFLTLLLIVGINVQAQHNLPGKGEVFRDDILPSVYITIPADSLAAILDYDNRFNFVKKKIINMNDWRLRPSDFRLQ